MTTKTAKIAAAAAALDAAVETQTAARVAFKASGTDADLAAFNTATKARDEASAALADLGR